MELAVLLVQRPGAGAQDLARVVAERAGVPDQPVAQPRQHPAQAHHLVGVRVHRAAGRLEADAQIHGLHLPGTPQGGLEEPLVVPALPRRQAIDVGELLLRGHPREELTPPGRRQIHELGRHPSSSWVV